MDPNRNDLILEEIHRSDIHSITIKERFKSRFAITFFGNKAFPTRLFIVIVRRQLVREFNTKMLFSKVCKCRPTIYGVISCSRLLCSLFSRFLFEYVLLLVFIWFGFIKVINFPIQFIFEIIKPFKRMSSFSFLPFRNKFGS